MNFTWKALAAAVIVECSFAPNLWPQDYPPGVLYVTFQSGAIDSLWEDTTGFIHCGIPYIDSINHVHNCQDFRFIGHPALSLSANDYHVIFQDSVNIPALATAYQTSLDVRYARPDYYAELLYTPNDSFFSREGLGLQCDQWNLDKNHCQFEKAWDITRGDTGVVIAVIDVGCYYGHPDLKENLWINHPEDINGSGAFEPLSVDSGGDIDTIDQDGNGFKNDVIGYNFRQNGPPNPYIPAVYHGTVVSSIAAARTDNLRGVSGAGFSCRLMVVSMDVPPEVPLPLSVIIPAVEYATKMNPEVINMSWVTHRTLDPGLREVLDTAYGRNIVLIGGAGNSSDTATLYPAYYPSVISVSGLKWNDVKDPVATYNASVDLSAPIEA